MLYPFLYNRRTKRNIAFSQMLIIDGKNQVRIYVDEPPNENFGDFLELEFYLPDGNVTKQIGFTSKEVLEIKALVLRNADCIWELAEEYTKEKSLRK